MRPWVCVCVFLGTCQLFFTSCWGDCPYRIYQKRHTHGWPSTQQGSVAHGPALYIHTHGLAWLPGCVLKMAAAWQGFACGAFFIDTMCNTRVKAKFIIAHLLGCITVVHVFQEPCYFTQNLIFTIPNNTAGLCAIGRAVCFQHGCVQFRRAVRLVYI